MDLYDLSEWEPRTVFDRICVYFSRGSGALITAGFALSAVLLLCITVASFLFSPLFGAFTLLSLVPALFFVAYIWDTDPYEKLPAGLILVTFLLCGLLVAVPLGVNTATVGFFGKLTGGMAVFFFLVVAPVEETVKLLAVRLYGYDKDVFDSAADGAVLGAVAGLAFAMVENGV